MDIVAIVTKFLLGGSLAVTIIVVWMKWGIERRRMRIKRQQQLIDTWRTELPPLLIKNQVNRSEFLHHPAYASLKPYLSPKLVSDLESNTIFLTAGGSPLQGLHKKLIDEIAQIEKKWKLVDRVQR
jgi:hypothetical protein